MRKKNEKFERTKQQKDLLKGGRPNISKNIGVNVNEAIIEKNR